MLPRKPAEQSGVRRPHQQPKRSSPGESDRSGLLGMQRMVGNAATRRAVEEPLDPSVRAGLERRFGSELIQVRVRRDGAAAARVGGIAYTVGDRITVDPDRYRPGTVAGDVLMAHEVAHTVQQREGKRGGHTGDEHDIEADADRAALSTVSDRPSGFLPALRSALSLRRCKGCTPEEEKWLSDFRAERDPERLSDMLRPRTDSELSRLSQAEGGDQLHTDAVTWERAWRAREYARLSRLIDGVDPRLRVAYGRRVTTAMMEGTLSVRITGGDAAFRSFVQGAFTDLAATPHGLRLILDLLATNQQVNLEPAAAGAGHNTNPADTSRARLSTQVTDEHDPNAGRPLPPAQQRPGSGTGSVITLDASTMGNEVTLGGTPAQPVIIDANSTALVGHELIHALHNARGINIGMGGIRRMSGLADPVTGEPENPEELYAMTGQTSFTPVRGRTAADLSQPMQYNVPSTVTENDLRADLNLPARSSHFGALNTIAIPRGASVTVEALIARYRLPSGAVPPAGAAIIRTMLAAVPFTDEVLARLPADFQISVPHPDHILMRIRFVDRNTVLADQMDGLTIR